MKIILGTVQFGLNYGINNSIGKPTQEVVNNIIDLAYNSKNQFFKYRGLKYIIQGTPINIGFEDREIQITLKQESLKEVNDITPIGGIEFPYTFNFQLT